MEKTAHNKGVIDLEHYARLLLRQKWFIILPAILGVLLMTLFSLTLNNLYKANTTVLVEQSRLPGDMVKDIIGSDTPYIRSLVEQVKSVSSLEKVIKKYNLYPEMRKKATLEEVVAHMRERIEIANRGNDTFSIAFIGEDPKLVQDVAEELTAMFINQNVEYRLEQAHKTVDFLDKQAEQLRAEVQIQEKKIQQYKSENLHLLPEHRLSTQTQLNAAQQRLQANADGLTRAQAQLIAAKERAAMLEPSRAVMSRAAVSGERVTEAEQRLAKAQQEFSSKYSPMHPDYETRKLEIEALERDVAAARRRSTPSVSKVGQTPEFLRARDEVRLAEAEIDRLNAEQIALKQQISDLSQRLEAVPRVELELNTLAEGLQVKRDQADAFQKKATEAAASLALEQGNQGSQFRALDHARLPEKPISPNRPLLVIVGAVAGLMVGFSLVVGLDLLFRPFLDEQDLARFTGVQVLVSIPHVGPFPSEWQRFRGQVSNLMGYLLGSFNHDDEEYVSGALNPPAATATPVTPRRQVRPAVMEEEDTVFAGFAAAGGGDDYPAGPRGSAPRGPNAAAGGMHRQDRYEAPPITRANPRSTYNAAPGQGNGRIFYASPKTEEIPRSALRPEPRPQPESRNVRRPAAPIEVVVVEEPRPVMNGARVARMHETQVFPAVEVIERVPGANGSQTAMVVGGSWGSPTRYVITSRPARHGVGEETMKELFRRPPWTGKES